MLPIENKSRYGFVCSDLKKTINCRTTVASPLKMDVKLNIDNKANIEMNVYY